jgi:hypothetical protein
MTSILLRQRTTLAYNLMERVGAEALSTFKAQLLQTLQIETERILLRSYVNLVSTMTVTFLVNKSMFLKFLRQLSYFIKSKIIIENSIPTQLTQ